MLIKQDNTCCVNSVNISPIIVIITIFKTNNLVDKVIPHCIFVCSFCFKDY